MEEFLIKRCCSKCSLFVKETLENNDFTFTEDVNKCIYHANKQHWITLGEIENSILVKLFWERIRDYIKIINSSVLQKYYFQNFIFPESEITNNLLKNNPHIYSQGNFFSNNELSFEKSVDFTNAEFINKADFEYVIFNESVYFGGTKFRDEINFRLCKFNKTTIFESLLLRNNDLDFYKSVFDDNFEMTLRNSSTSIINFNECVFNKIAIFDDLIAHELLFQNSKFFENCKMENLFIQEIMDLNNVDFFKNVSLNDSKFQYTINLIDTTFYSNASFIETVFLELNLERTTFLGNTNFLNASSDFSDNNKIELNIKNRETARIIKNSFEQQNNIIEANRFYALEMKEREKELSPFKNLFEWLTFKIHGMASDHSQDWLLALFWILSFTFTSTFVYFINKKLDTSLEFILVDIFIYFVFIGLSYLIYHSRYNNYWAILGLYIIYVIGTLDLTLYNLSNHINPFSIMTGFSKLTFEILIYKIIIAYLIYQLIVSVRQNTRRK